MISLVTLEIDDVLRGTDWELPFVLSSKLADLKNAGVILSIVTGRELLSALYFVYINKFPFDYLCPGGGSVIEDPANIRFLDELFQPVNIHHIYHGGLTKVGRINLMQNITGIKPENTIHIDSSMHPTDMPEAKVKLSCKLATVRSNNIGWISLVQERHGIISQLSKTAGTLDILNQLEY